MKNTDKPFSLRARFESIGYALTGIKNVAIQEHNSRVHFAATVTVLVAAQQFRVSTTEWCLLILAIALVWSAEAMNTAIEALADVVHPEQHPTIKLVKDAAAGAVLIIAIAAAVVGLIIFLPYILAAIDL